MRAAGQSDVPDGGLFGPVRPEGRLGLSESAKYLEFLSVEERSIHAGDAIVNVAWRNHGTLRLWRKGVHGPDGGKGLKIEIQAGRFRDVNKFIETEIKFRIRAELFVISQGLLERHFAAKHGENNLACAIYGVLNCHSGSA
jgi:hypothetical protein